MTLDRREFLTTTSAVAGLFTIVPPHVLGGRRGPAPSDVITQATIGTGGQGMGHVLENGRGPIRQLAVCDVDRRHRTRALKKAGRRGCEAYTDFRAVLDRPDIDVVHI